MVLEVNALFNMKTAYSKVVHCILHKLHFEGKDLDSGYTKFKEMQCENCKDQKPRPERWSFSGRSTPEEAEFLFSLIGTPYNMRHFDED